MPAFHSRHTLETSSFRYGRRSSRVTPGLKLSNAMIFTFGSLGCDELLLNLLNNFSKRIGWMKRAARTRRVGKARRQDRRTAGPVTWRLSRSYLFHYSR